MAKGRRGFGLVACAALVMSCSGSGSQSDNGQGLASPDVGFQLASTTVTLDPGQERYACWSFKLPAALNITSTVTGLPKTGVHHYAVFTNTAEVPDNPSGYDCLVMGASWGLVTGGGVGTPGLTFPQGTAMQLAAGTHVVLQLHLLNASSKALEIPRAAINLVGSNDATLQKVGLVVAGALNLHVPAHQAGVVARSHCALPFPMKNVFALFPHMHTLGTHIAMSIAKPNNQSAPQTLLDRDWDFGTQGVYPATGSAAQGDEVGVQCTYTNPGDKDVNFGESTNDEMCLGVFYYYPLQGDGISTYCFDE